MPLRPAPYLALIKDTSFFSPSHRDVWTVTEFTEILAQNPTISWALLIKIDSGEVITSFLNSHLPPTE